MMDSENQELVEHVISLTLSSQILVAVFDASDRLRFANPAFREAYCIGSDESPTWREFTTANFEHQRGAVVRTTDFESWILGAQSLRGKSSYRAFELDIHGGRWLWMTETVHRNGWMLCTAFDISTLRIGERSVREARDMAIRASQTDDLTGVANRRFVMARIEDLLRRRSRRREPSVGCLAIVDIDNFKYINDRFGHAGGDDVLRDFARKISSNVRLADCFGRVGGEEFVLVMPNTTAEAGSAIVGRMLSLIRKSAPLAIDRNFRYSFSAGVAETRSRDSATELYRRADQALYTAKTSGRNRIVVFEEAIAVGFSPNDLQLPPSEAGLPELRGDCGESSD